jgi:hypothetical protein
MSKPSGFLSLDQRKSVGAHYTPAILADFVAKEIVSTLHDSHKSKMLRVLDPAVGDGELLRSILDQFLAIGFLNIAVIGFDTAENAILHASERLDLLFPTVSKKLLNENFLEFIQTSDGNDLFNTGNAENTFCTFGDIGKVRVGVKTTADDVFINPDWDNMHQEEQPELLKPLITHHIARRYKAMQTEKPKRILYPHVTEDGKRRPADLEKYPKTAAYLNLCRPILEKREYIMKSGRKWFEIWVPHHPHIWSQPKIVFRDISKSATCWMGIFTYNCRSIKLHQKRSLLITSPRLLMTTFSRGILLLASAMPLWIITGSP